jgi:hypothetical protein
VEFDHSFYSVPYQRARQVVEVRATPTTVEIFHQATRVASHLRAHKPNTPVTASEHRPKSHRAHLEWPPSRMLQWAQTVGTHTAQVVTQIMDTGAVSYKRIDSILRRSLDQTPLSATTPARTGSTHDNVRGAAYFE